MNFPYTFLPYLSPGVDFLRILTGIFLADFAFVTAAPHLGGPSIIHKEDFTPSDINQ